MNNLQSLTQYGLKNTPVVVENLPKNNIRMINFKAGEDQFVRQDRNGKQTRPAILQQQPMMVQQDPMIRMLEQRQKEEKKAKMKQNFTWGLGIATSLLFATYLIWQFRMMKGGGMPEVGAFNMSNLEFKNLSKDENIFDIRTSKSLHKKVKEFFTNLLDKGDVPESIAKRAGTLGEAGTNSVLLLGGSGVGKTEVIKAYAKAADADYVAIKVSDFANQYVNGTSKNITEMIEALIQRAKNNPKKQLVISLDEVDALVKVTVHDSSGEIAKNRQSLLTGLDSLLELPNIKLFTSSNANIKDLDGAFLRRCGYNFEVPMPEKAQLLEALKFQLRKCEGATENSGKFFENNSELDKFLDKLVERKCAFGDIKNISKAAKDFYELDMHKANDPKKKFAVSYLKKALDNIETTAGEKAAREGAFV